MLTDTISSTQRLLSVVFKTDITYFELGSISFYDDNYFVETPLLVGFQQGWQSLSLYFPYRLLDCCLLSCIHLWMGLLFLSIPSSHTSPQLFRWGAPTAVYMPAILPSNILLFTECDPHILAAPISYITSQVFYSLFPVPKLTCHTYLLCSFPLYICCSQQCMLYLWSSIVSLCS